jgi:hypothetical protein
MQSIEMKYFNMYILNQIKPDRPAYLHVRSLITKFHIDLKATENHLDTKCEKKP